MLNSPKTGEVRVHGFVRWRFSALAQCNNLPGTGRMETLLRRKESWQYDQDEAGHYVCVYHKPNVIVVFT